MFEQFTKRGIPPRHRNSPFMDLAFGKLPTIATADWDTDPVGLANLTDDDPDTHLTTDGVTVVTAAAKKGIKIDLGQIYEIYEIRVKNRAGEGVKVNNNASAGQIRVITSINGSTYTDRTDEQVPDAVFIDADVDYIGNGIPVRYVMIEFHPDGTYYFTVDLSTIEVFGC